MIAGLGLQVEDFDLVRRISGWVRAIFNRENYRGRDLIT